MELGFSPVQIYHWQVRQGAGLLLKNNLKDQYAGLAEEHKAYIKVGAPTAYPCLLFLYHFAAATLMVASLQGLLLLVLAHPSRPLRQTAGTIASVVVGAGGLAPWPQLISAISAHLQSSDDTACDGGISTLYKLVEDQPSQLETRLPGLGVDAAGRPPTANCILVPLLLKLMQAASADVRCKAVASLNLLTREMPVALMDQLDTYLQGMFALAHDASVGVRREVCIGLVQLVTIQPNRLAPFLYQV